MKTPDEEFEKAVNKITALLPNVDLARFAKYALRFTECTLEYQNNIAQLNKEYIGPILEQRPEHTPEPAPVSTPNKLSGTATVPQLEEMKPAYPVHHIWSRYPTEVDQIQAEINGEDSIGSMNNIF